MAAKTTPAISLDPSGTRGFRVTPTFFLLFLWSVGVFPLAGFPQVEIESIPGQGEPGILEIEGVSAGVFNPSFWEKGTLHFLPDHRHPLLEPRWTGRYRNIYAPSVVETLTGWRFFYGAWDGVRTPNDRIYSVQTHNLLDFFDRRLVVDHGPFIHVCNVNAIPLGFDGFRMACTAYPDEKGLNKPVFFQSPDGKKWNGQPEPYSASKKDRIEIDGYAGFAEGDLNGMNVLLREGDELRFYFNNFKDPGKVYRATSDGRTTVFTFEGPVLETPHIVNDVKKFHVDGSDYYLMGLHVNGDRLWYSLSGTGDSFEPEKELLEHRGEEDRYIVSMGWVKRGNRLLGVVYGAGSVPELNRNRIFARWLQYKVVFVSEDGRRFEPTEALGPDRQRISVPTDIGTQGTFRVYAEDGVTPLGEPVPVVLTENRLYRFTWNPPESQFESLVDPDLSAWEKPGGGPPPGWSVRDGVITFSGKGSYLKLKNSSLGDFILRMDYRLPPDGNSGIFIRSPLSGFDAFQGVEIQLLDDAGEKYQKMNLVPSQFTGSIYKVVPPSERVTRPGGEWNTMEVFARGPRIRVTLNGKVVVDASMDDYPELENRPRRGWFGFQNHGSTLEFRKVRMVRLD